MSEDTAPKKKKAPMTVMKERIAALEEENAALKEQLTASLQNTADMAGRAEEDQSEIISNLRKEVADLKERLREAYEAETKSTRPGTVYVGPAEPEAAKPPVDRAAALQRISEIEGLIAMGGLSDGKRKMLKIEKRDLQLSL